LLQAYHPLTTLPFPVKPLRLLQIKDRKTMVHCVLEVDCNSGWCCRPGSYNCSPDSAWAILQHFPFGPRLQHNQSEFFLSAADRRRHDRNAGRTHGDNAV